jgi:uncharacterized protein
MIPSINSCFGLMERYTMLEHIKAHSVVVAKVAHLLARSLAESGIAVSIEKTTAGALLHDIGKTSSLGSGEDHSEIGRQICLENGLDEIADIVGEHVRLKGFSLYAELTEKEIVFYSDKRVNHDQIVPLEDRLAYIIERYGRNTEICKAIKANFELCRKVEEKLFSKANFAVDVLRSLAEAEEIQANPLTIG